MKTILMFGFLAVTGFTSSAYAQVSSAPGTVYREYAVSINVSNGETKELTLQVNPELEVVVHGDPEIPAHGFYDYNVTGSVVENGKTCNFEVLLTQTDLYRATTDETLKSRRDRSGTITVCSGLSLELASVKALLLDGSSSVSLKAPGMEKSIGAGSMVSQGLKTVPEPKDDSYEDWLK